MPFVHLVPLDRYNWEEVIDLQLSPDQQAFIPGTLYSLAQAKFENLTPLGIMADSRMVGLVMYGEFGGICWISRIMIDYDHQRQGIGREAMQELLTSLKRNISCKEIRTSHAINNYAAADFFSALGFKPVADPLEDEVVMTLG